MPFLSLIGAAAAAKMGQVSSRKTTTAGKAKMLQNRNVGGKYLTRQTAPWHHEVIELYALSVAVHKMCLKSPGTDVGAAGFERCPRTFETHFTTIQ